MEVVKSGSGTLYVYDSDGENLATHAIGHSLVFTLGEPHYNELADLFTLGEPHYNELADLKKTNQIK